MSTPQRFTLSSLACPLACHHALPEGAGRMPNALAALAALGMLLALGGCTSTPTALEQSLGASVRLAVDQQKVPPPSARGPQRTDGVIAVHGVDRYQQSYERPPAPVNVLNLLGGSGSASASPSGMSR